MNGIKTTNVPIIAKNEVLSVVPMNTFEITNAATAKATPTP